MITKDGIEGQIRNTLWETHGISRYNTKNNYIQIENKAAVISAVLSAMSVADWYLDS